jgi:hypothetical protein
VLLHAQGTLDQYRRAVQIREQYPSLADNIAEGPMWVEGGNSFMYRKAVKGGHEFVQVGAQDGSKRPAFDQARVAAALSKATGETIEPLKLPFSTVGFEDKVSAISFVIGEQRWRAKLSDYSVERVANPDGRRSGFGAAWAREQPPAEGGGISGQARLFAEGELCRIITDRPAPAETRHNRIRKAG